MLITLLRVSEFACKFSTKVVGGVTMSTDASGGAVISDGIYVSAPVLPPPAATAAVVALSASPNPLVAV